MVKYSQLYGQVVDTLQLAACPHLTWQRMGLRLLGFSKGAVTLPCLRLLSVAAGGTSWDACLSKKKSQRWQMHGRSMRTHVMFSAQAAYFRWFGHVRTSVMVRKNSEKSHCIAIAQNCEDPRYANSGKTSRSPRRFILRTPWCRTLKCRPSCTCRRGLGQGLCTLSVRKCCLVRTVTRREKQVHRGSTEGKRGPWQLVAVEVLLRSGSGVWC